jgi:hypothetical protein
MDQYDKISYYDLMSYRANSDKKLNNSEAMRVVREMLGDNSSCLIIREHCILRMKERGINQRDIINVLLGGRCTGAEPHIASGYWVYRFETGNYRVECNINVGRNIIAITVIKKRRP